jgi:hypothetical protein
MGGVETGVLENQILSHSCETQKAASGYVSTVKAGVGVGVCVCGWVGGWVGGWTGW